MATWDLVSATSQYHLSNYNDVIGKILDKKKDVIGKIMVCTKLLYYENV